MKGRSALAGAASFSPPNSRGALQSSQGSHHLEHEKTELELEENKKALQNLLQKRRINVLDIKVIVS